MNELPEDSNFFGTILGNVSKEDVVRLFLDAGWHARKCTWFDYEVSCRWAELVVEGDTPILIHGVIADFETNVAKIKRLLDSLAAAYSIDQNDGGNSRTATP